MTPRELILRNSARMKEAGIPDPVTDSALILSFLLKRPPLDLRADMESDVPPEIQKQTEQLVSRRLKREPLQYLLGEAPFFGRMFTAVPGTLIPRPETEELCRWALEAADGIRQPVVIDLCAGSGCIGLTFKLERKDADVILLELSDDAIRTAALNTEKFAQPVTILKSDLFSALSGVKADLILSNPPYIPSGQCASLQEEVRYEPLTALDGGEDGLLFYRRIAREAKAYLKPDGYLMLEIGDGEAQAVKDLLTENGWTGIEIRRDLAGRERVIGARLRQALSPKPAESAQERRKYV